MKSQRRRFAVESTRRLFRLLVISVGVVQAAQRDPMSSLSVSQHLEAAQIAEKAQDYPSASREYQAILKLQPESALIRQSLAVTYHLQNRYPEAIAEFQRALRLDPTLWGSDLFLGMDYYKTNQFELALPPLEKSIALNAKKAEPEARFWLAVTDSALNRPEDAVRELRRDMALRPGDIDVLYYLSKAYDQAADFSFGRLGTIEPQGAAVALLEAERLLEENREDLARVQYRHALRLRPDFAGWIPSLSGGLADPKASEEWPISEWDARLNLDLASLLAAAGDTGQAVAVLKNLASQKAEKARSTALIAEAARRRAAVSTIAEPVRIANAADILQGISLVRERHFREAQEPLGRAAAANTDPFLQLLLMRAYVETGDSESVEERLRQLSAKQPANIDALHLLGRAYKQQAEAALQRMIRLDADFYGVHELLGKQHEEKTEYDPAIQEYKAALEKRPDLAGIRYAIGNVYRKMSQYDEAEKWLTGELARNPYHGLAHYRLGSIYTEQGKPDAAIPHLKQALLSHPHLTDAELDLGRAYTAKGNYDEALTTLKKVVVSDSENDRVHYLLSVVYSKQGRPAEARTELALYQRLTRERLTRTQQEVKSLANSVDQ